MPLFEILMTCDFPVPSFFLGLLPLFFLAALVVCRGMKLLLVRECVCRFLVGICLSGGKICRWREGEKSKASPHFICWGIEIAAFTHNVVGVDVSLCLMDGKSVPTAVSVAHSVLYYYLVHQLLDCRLVYFYKRTSSI